jgi:translation initiation factor 3 subunit E
MNCPHLLRYLTTAVIVNKRRKLFLKDIIRVLQQERRNYTDPIIEFFLSLYVEFDFEAASAQLKQCEQLFANDFFLGFIQAEFMENARLLLFETYCRIHRTIQMDQLSRALDLKPEEQEQVIVDLIRISHVEAKIDSRSNTIVMQNEFASVYQQVIDKTKSLAYRSGEMQDNIAKKYQIKFNQEQQNQQADE